MLALLLAYSVSGKSRLQFKLLNSLMIETKTYVNKILTHIQYLQKNKMFNVPLVHGVGHFQARFL